MERIKRTEESQSESCRQSAQRFNLISFILGLEVFFSLDLTFSRLESLSGGRCSQSVQQKYPETNGGDAFPGNGKAFVRYIICATFRYTRNDTIHIRCSGAIHIIYTKYFSLSDWFKLSHG